MILNCKHCNSTDTSHYKQVERNGREHLVRICNTCNYRTNVPSKSEQAKRLLTTLSSPPKRRKKELKRWKERARLAQQTTLNF